MPDNNLARGFPGKRVESNRAGIIAATLCIEYFTIVGFLVQGEFERYCQIVVKSIQNLSILERSILCSVNSDTESKFIKFLNSIEH
jgi:hypothetical protein